MSELALIERLAARNPTRPGTSLGIGDDAAVLEVGPAAVVTHDMLVEDVHFRRATTSLGDLGHKAIAVNLSDLAAMGAEPVAVLVGLGLPVGGLSGEDVDALYGGIDAIAAEHGVTVAGGDLTTAPVLTLAVTAVGRPAPGVAPVTRSGGRPGDLLCVTGSLGAAAAGLLLLDDPRLLPDLPARAGLIAAQCRPVPLVAAGRALAAAGVHAMMDVSDGLALDAGRMASASGLRARLDLAAVPVAPGAGEVARSIGAEPAVFAATSGEDYGLLVALDPRDLDACSAAAGGPLTPVGMLEAGPPGVEMRDRAGALVVPGRSGWQHDL